LAAISTDATSLMGQTEPDFEYLAVKLNVRGAAELRERRLVRCAELDLNKLAADIESFITKPRDIERVILFPQYIAERL